MNPTTQDITLDRPGWIPAQITNNWDPNPYAYQTEDELMPAGGLHGQLVPYIIELLRYWLKQRGLMVLFDTFLLYRDQKGVKQRIAPDLILMPYREDPPTVYDLEVEPLPLLLVEVTSPQSHLADLQHKVRLYTHIGVPAYLAIDAISPRNKRRQEIRLFLWRREEGELETEYPDDLEGFALPEMGVHLRAEGQKLLFTELETGQVLGDMEVERKARLRAEQAEEAERQAKEAERQARLQAEAEVARLRALLETNSQSKGGMA